MKTIDVPLPPRRPFFPVEARLTLLDFDGRPCEGITRVLVPASVWVISGGGIANGETIDLGKSRANEFFAISVVVETHDWSIDVQLRPPKTLQKNDRLAFPPNCLQIL